MSVKEQKVSSDQSQAGSPVWRAKQLVLRSFTITKKVARVSPQLGKRAEQIPSQGKCKETEKGGARVVCKQVGARWLSTEVTWARMRKLHRPVIG